MEKKPQTISRTLGKIYISKFARVWQWSFSKGKQVSGFTVEVSLEEDPDSTSQGTLRIQNNL